MQAQRDNIPNLIVNIPNLIVNMSRIFDLMLCFLDLLTLTPVVRSKVKRKPNSSQQVAFLIKSTKGADASVDFS